MSKLDAYRKADASLPNEYRAWQVFGAGLDNVGRDGKPVTLELREPREDEILVRVDVLGLCLSDMKIIAQGGNHPRLRGRDLATDPTVLGHECACTVVKAGKQWEDKFKVGQRYLVQADVYYKGIGYAFGYVIPGGLAEYAYIDSRILDGDEGCYLLPVDPATGYSQVALAEPWACVEMSYCLENRVEPTGQAQLIVTDTPAEWKGRFPNATYVPGSLGGLGEGKFDDIIIPRPAPSQVTALAPRLKKNGVMFLLGLPPESGPANIDIGAIHYENHRYLGGGDTLEAVAEANRRNDLKPGGSALFIGAGGPMGQMHVQRAIEKADGPRLVVVTDLDGGRLAYIRKRFGAMAALKGKRLETLAPDEFPSPYMMNETIKSYAPMGYDDVVVLAPVAMIVQQAMGWVADFGFVNVFAGLGIGTMADIPIDALCRGVKIVGSSGSRISDLRRILGLVEGNQLDTNRSVAAIGGLNAAQAGLKAVKDAKYPGKTIIYTQIADLPLMSLEEAPERIPELKDKLSPEGAWTKEAEAALLEKYL